MDSADRSGEEEDDLVESSVPKGGVTQVLNVSPLPLDLLVEGLAARVVGRVLVELLGSVLQLRENLQLGVES